MTAAQIIDTLTLINIRAQRHEYRQRAAAYYGIPWAAVVDADHEEALLMNPWQQRWEFDLGELVGGEVAPHETVSISGEVA